MREMSLWQDRAGALERSMSSGMIMSWPGYSHPALRDPQPSTCLFTRRERLAAHVRHIEIAGWKQLWKLTDEDLR